MPGTPTPNYGWPTGAVGGDNNNWGNEINNALVDIDAQVFAVQGVANAALPKSGGAMTGRLDAQSATMSAAALGTLVAATNIDCSLANYFTFTVGAAFTLSFINVPTTASSAFGVIMRITNGGVGITWPASVKWPSGTPPVLTASGTDLLAFITDDNGTTWRMIAASLNVK